MNGEHPKSEVVSSKQQCEHPALFVQHWRTERVEPCLYCDRERLRAALSLAGECLSRGYWKIGTELTQRANAAIIEALSGDSPSPHETTEHQSEYPQGFFEGFIHASDVLVGQGEAAVYARADHYRKEMKLVPPLEPPREYGPPADHCEKHGLHRAFAGGCPQCYHEKHDLPRASENGGR